MLIAYVAYFFFRYFLSFTLSLSLSLSRSVLTCSRPRATLSLSLKYIKKKLAPDRRASKVVATLWSEVKILSIGTYYSILYCDAVSRRIVCVCGHGVC